ncbi:MAG: hypothetical protein JKY56_15460 [Kofleriaceae bacterium]|nr:hypothetical protein [Kofleriaceae bacterium]
MFRSCWARACWAICLSLLASCGKDKAESHKIARNTGTAAVVVVGSTEASESSLAKEQEPNNIGDEIRQEIAVSSSEKKSNGYQGTLDGYLDVDVFGLRAAEEGMLFVKLEGAADADLRLELQGPEGKTLAYSDRGPAKTSEGIGGFWVDVGDYRVVVSEFTKRKAKKNKAGRQGESAVYTLTAQIKEVAEDYEVEPNKSLEGAMEIPTDAERFGYLGWKNDADLWRLPVIAQEGEDGALAIELSGLPSVRTKLAILDAQGKELLEVRSSKGNETAIRNFVPNEGAEFYLVRIHAKRSNPETPYALRIRSEVRPPGREAEPNNDLQTATPLPESGGSLVLGSGELSQGDLDFFEVPSATENRILEVRLEGRSGMDFTLAVIAESGAVLATSADAPVGIVEVVKQVNIPPGVKARIRIAAKSVNLPTEYSFSVSLVAGQANTPHPSQVAPMPVSTPTPLPTPETSLE